MEIICNSGVKGDFTVLLIIPCVRNSSVKEIHSSVKEIHSSVKEIHSSVKGIFISEYEHEYDTFI